MGPSERNVLHDATRKAWRPVFEADRRVPALVVARAESSMCSARKDEKHIRMVFRSGVRWLLGCLCVGGMLLSGDRRKPGGVGGGCEGRIRCSCRRLKML